MPTVYLSLGANCGDRISTIRKAMLELEKSLGNMVWSRVYITPDCHGGALAYMNAVGKAVTALRPEEMELLAKHLEAEFGRLPELRRHGLVPLDIDLVVYDGTVTKDNDFRREFFQIGYRQIESQLHR